MIIETDADIQRKVDMRISVSKSELESGELTQENLQNALAAIRETGYTILNDIVQHEHLDILQERMTEDSIKMINDETMGRLWTDEGASPAGAAAV